MNHESLEKLIYFGIRMAYADERYQVYSKYHVRGNSNKTVKSFEGLVNPCPDFSADGMVVKTHLMDKPEKFMYEGIENVAMIFGKSDNNGLVWIPYQRLKEILHDQVLFSNLQFNTLQVKSCETRIVLAITHPEHNTISFSKPLPLYAFVNTQADGFWRKPSSDGFKVNPGALYHNFKRWEEMPNRNEVPMSFFENEHGYSIFWTLRHQADLIKEEAKKVNYEQKRAFFIKEIPEVFKGIDTSSFNKRPFVFTEGNTGKSMGTLEVTVEQLQAIIEHFKKDVKTPMDHEDMLSWCVKNYPQITITPKYSPWESPGLYSISKKILHRSV